MKEIWKPIHNWELLYHASNKGRIKRLYRISNNPLPSGKIRKMHLEEKILEPHLSKFNGYYMTSLTIKNKSVKIYVHRIICETFNGHPKKFQETRHMDGNKKNNYSNNLKWGSSFENSSDMIAHGTTAKGSKHGRSKLTEDDVYVIKQCIQKGYSTTWMSIQFNVNQSTISNIKTGKNWKWLTI